jgi:hypothetical protein
MSDHHGFGHTKNRSAAIILEIKTFKVLVVDLSLITDLRDSTNFSTIAGKPFEP